MRETIYKHALKNALDYGRANEKAVLGKLLAEKPEFKRNLDEARSLVHKVVKEVNALSGEELKKELSRFEFEEKTKAKGGLPDLEDSEKVVLRFAPNPSGPLHIGHSRAAVLNDEYAKMYEGELILRLEDTDPKRVDPDAYEMIKEDLRWLGVTWHKEVCQSSRLDLYYHHARELIEMGKAYVCDCKQSEFKELRDKREACPCRDTVIKENLEKFEGMFSLPEGRAVLRLKTNLKHPNPSIRDYPIIRIVDAKHPLAGAKKVYPLMNFSVAVDDHLLGMTHVLRGKDHIVNTEKQKYIYDYFGWDAPYYIHYGILKIGEVALSTSQIKRGIEEGEYSGWDDAKLGTLLALKKRGFQPEAIRKAMLGVGVKTTDISFSWKNLYAYNREIIEPKADRYFFVADPKELVVEGCEDKIVKNRLHPDYPDRGSRKLKIKTKGRKAKFFISKTDFDSFKRGDKIRLMGAFNIEITVKDERLKARYLSEELDVARKDKMRPIHWVPEEKINVKVVMPNEVLIGFGEGDLKKVNVGDIIQFERFGFVRIDSKDDEELTAYLLHR
ncbi:MAG: glutamate--tRNA ligase [Candidatus Hydrothermarchaeales archaeon]